MQEKKKTAVDRRRFLTSLGLIGTAAGISPLSVLATPKPAPARAGSLMVCKPYLQAAGEDKMTVRWITSTPCYSWVEYGELPDKLTRKACQVEDGLIQVDNTIHAVVLDDLQPGKTYYYRCLSKKVDSIQKRAVVFGDEANSAVYSFTTVPGKVESVRFLVFNDIHDRPESFAHLLKLEGGGHKDFVVLNGDIFNTVVDEQQVVDNLIIPLSELFAARVPFVFSRGNHDTWGNYARQFTGYVDGREHKFYYSFQYGPAYFIVLDSGDGSADEGSPNGIIKDFDSYREKQGRWLEQEVKKEAFRKAKYRIVFAHIPPYYTKSRVHASQHCRQVWEPVLNPANIDLMICGHTHKYGVHQPVAGGHNFPIVIGGGPLDGQRTLISVNVTQQALNLRMLDDAGKMVGTLDL